MAVCSALCAVLIAFNLDLHVCVLRTCRFSLTAECLFSLCSRNRFINSNRALPKINAFIHLHANLCYVDGVDCICLHRNGLKPLVIYFL